MYILGQVGLKETGEMGGLFVKQGRLKKDLSCRLLIDDAKVGIWGELPYSCCMEKERFFPP